MSTKKTPLLYKALLLLSSLIFTSCNSTVLLKNLLPNLSSSLSILSTSSTQVAVGGSVTLTMTLKDARNKAFTKTVPVIVISKSGGSSDGNVGAIVNNGSGIYTATFTGVTVGAPVTITATANGMSITNSVSIEVVASTPSNNAPVTSVQTLSVNDIATLPITLAATDADGDTLTYTYSNPAHGTLTGTAPNLTYTPTAPYGGADSFTFIANDGTSDSNISTVSITVIHAGTGMYFCPHKLTTPDYLWATVANWYLDSGCSVSANSIPLDGDSVYVEGNNFIDQPGAISLASFVGSLSSNGNSESLHISIEAGGSLIVSAGYWFGSSDATATVAFNGYSRNDSTVSGDATFNNNSLNNSTVSGGATFNGSSYNDNSGSVSGGATFNGSSSNNGQVYGDATFNDTSTANGRISGDATFNGSADCSHATISDATFNGNSTSHWCDTSSATFNDASSNHGPVNSATFNGTTNYGYTYGDTMYDNGINVGYTYGTTRFYGTSTNGDGTTAGSVIGHAIFNHTSSNTSTGVVTGNGDFNDSGYNNGTVSDSIICNTTSSSCTPQ